MKNMLNSQKKKKENKNKKGKNMLENYKGWHIEVAFHHLSTNMDNKLRIKIQRITHPCHKDIHHNFQSTKTQLLFVDVDSMK